MTPLDDRLQALAREIEHLDQIAARAARFAQFAERQLQQAVENAENRQLLLQMLDDYQDMLRHEAKQENA